MTSSFEAPWIEKYRPQFLSDVVGNAEAVSRLAAISQVPSACVETCRLQQQQHMSSALHSIAHVNTPHETTVLLNVEAHE